MTDSTERRGTEVAVRKQDHMVDPEQEIEAQAQLLKAKWGTSTSLGRDDWIAICRIARASGMNPVWDLDLLGNQPYDKADFWIGMIAASPEVVDHKLTALSPDSPEWEEWVGSGPSDIAAAYLCEIRMKNGGVIHESNYVRKNDTLLYENDYRNFGTGDGAKEEALKWGREAGDEDPKIWWNNGNKKVSDKGWWCKRRVLRADWVGMAKKKCRTTTLRRAAKKAVPRQHAHVLMNIDRIRKVVERGLIAEATVVSDDPHGLNEEPGEPEIDEPDDDEFDQSEELVSLEGDETMYESSSIIQERHRRMLFAIANEHGMDEDELKKLICRVTGLPEEKASSRTLTYRQLRDAIDGIMEDASISQEEEDEDGEDAPEDEKPEDQFAVDEIFGA